MKKLISLLLALCLLLSLSSALADGNTLVYASDFTAGTDEWFARGAESVFRTTEATLRTEGRTSDWNSTGRYFELVAGNRYNLSVEVYQDGEDSAAFMISLERSLDGITELILDFEKLDYISSAGLRVLLEAELAMEAKGAEQVKVVNLNEAIRETFEITGFEQVVAID